MILDSIITKNNKISIISNITKIFTISKISKITKISISDVIYGKIYSTCGVNLI